MNDPITLEDTKFDVIIYGTGVTETYLSGALALEGKKVLHLEENKFYGSANASHPFTHFRGALEGYTEALERKTEEIPSCDALAIPEAYTRSPLSKFPPFINNASSSLFTPKEIKPEEEKEEKEEEKAEETLRQSLHAFDSESRRYSIDMATNMMWCHGNDIHNMVVAGTHRYIEFQCFKQSMFLDGDQIIPTPVTKKDIFRSKAISLLEKRMLMKFVLQVMEKAQSQATGDLEEEKVKEEHYDTFVEYMSSQKVSEKLQKFILFSVCLCASDKVLQDASSLSMEEGIQRVQKYQKSSNVHGATPFLYPLYGVSEINQGYSRLGAVHGTIFILNRGVNELVKENGKVKGVVCSVGQFFEAPVVVTTAKYLPSSTKIPSVSRMVVITEKSLVEEYSLIKMTVPPSGDSQQTIFISQLDSSVCVCPQDKLLLHFTSEASETSEEELKKLANRLLRYNDESDEKKPNALFSASFNLLEYTATEEHDGVLLCRDHIKLGGFEDALQEAKHLFHQIVGDDKEFFPERPDPNEAEEI